MSRFGSVQLHFPGLNAAKKLSAGACSYTLTPQTTGSARMRQRMSAAQATNWVGTAVPLAMCVAVWGVGGASPAHMPWLAVLHDMIGSAAAIWTVVQLVLKSLTTRVRRPTKLTWPHPGVLTMYILLIVQPILAVASSMLRGLRASIFEIPLPSLLQVNLSVARVIDRLHGLNALILLGVIVTQIVLTLSVLQSRRSDFQQ